MEKDTSLTSGAIYSLGGQTLNLQLALKGIVFSSVVSIINTIRRWLPLSYCCAVEEDPFELIQEK
jgi:hypothetical protein